MCFPSQQFAAPFVVSVFIFNPFRIWQVLRETLMAESAIRVPHARIASHRVAKNGTVRVYRFERRLVCMRTSSRVVKQCYDNEQVTTGIYIALGMVESRFYAIWKLSKSKTCSPSMRS